ncbi:glycosyltransferase [Ferruginivarius sediminum]|uniref:Glycosyltransferase n=1 Tax=Ferruginivarius sediminum TaxID=2661937 RepID=A0A369TAA1_9PROT|nr:glycosyltransferase [Ferruginivarius sediminum]
MMAIVLHKLAGGGVQHSLLALAEEFRRRGHDVQLVVCRDDGQQSELVPPGVECVHLSQTQSIIGRVSVLRAAKGARTTVLRPILLPITAPWHIKYLLGLSSYLRRQRPRIIFSAGAYTNAVTLWARRLAGASTKVVISEPVSFSQYLDSRRLCKWRWRYLAPLLNRVYPSADAIVTVSQGVADELACHANLDRTIMTPIYNPAVAPSLAERAAASISHPWLDQCRDRPVILSVGRLVETKDYPTLLRAFARIRQVRRVRLIILGDGKDREQLMDLARELEITDDVDMAGWVSNPEAYMARADVFALSSKSEGFGNVLVEAMACGCPVVSTDCPSGPREILADGDYGSLVPVGDSAALAHELVKALQSPTPKEALQARAAKFSLERSADEHLALFSTVSERDNPAK